MIQDLQQHVIWALQWWDQQLWRIQSFRSTLKPKLRIYVRRIWASRVACALATRSFSLWTGEIILIKAENMLIIWACSTIVHAYPEASLRSNLSNIRRPSLAISEAAFVHTATCFHLRRVLLVDIILIYTSTKRSAWSDALLYEL